MAARARIDASRGATKWRDLQGAKKWQGGGREIKRGRGWQEAERRQHAKRSVFYVAYDADTSVRLVWVFMKAKHNPFGTVIGPCLADYVTEQW